MDNEDFSQFKKRLSKINQLRSLFWNELREARNEFIKKYPSKDFQDDPQWQEIKCTLDDTWESTVREEFRRQLNLPRQGSGSGLYRSNKLCICCGMPLSGRQKSYCSENCRQAMKSRRYRKLHTEEKEMSNLKYLKFCYPDKKG